MKRLNDRYRLGERIGRGGVGEVFRGWQDSLDRPVAIKLLRPELTQHAAVVARFEREARTTCRLHHPNVVTVFDVGEAEDGTRFLVMELLEGETLAALLKRRKKLPVDEALAITRQIIRGMGAGQGVGLVHRDLKPDNIFLLAENHVKILDFGLATLLYGAGWAGGHDGPDADEPLPDPADPAASLPDPGLERLRPAAPTETLPDAAESVASIGVSRGRLTRPGTPVGTPRYMAPEQVLGWAVDHRSDLYSFGCILFEMLAGRSAFDGPGSQAYMQQHLHCPPHRLTDLVDVPVPIAEIVHRLLAKSPSDRFPDWSALADGLRLVTPRNRRGELPEEATSEEARPTEPYRFLNAFSRSSRSIFFGRDRDLGRFQTAWQHPDRPPIVVLTGASGVGKTSFLCARILPSLEDTGHHVIRVRGGTRPLQQVADVVSRELARTSDHVPERPLTQALDALAEQEARPIALVLDQLEEMFTSGRPEDITAFQADLAALVADGGGHEIRVLLSLREDYLGALLRAVHPLPMDELSRTIPLRPLESEDLKAALEGPARVGLPVAYLPFFFEEGLVHEIVADLLADAAGEVAPRVQAVGARLWEMVRQDPHPVITRAHYRERLGGARGILARILDEAITDLEPGDRGAAKELLRALTHLPGSPTSRPAAASELTLCSEGRPEGRAGGHADDSERRARILRRLEDRWRVVQGFHDPRWPDERTYRITHEALVARIQQYGEEGTERNRARQLFHHGLSLWLQGGRRDEDLMPEHHFDEVQRHIEDLVLRTPDEREFYEACRTQHNEGWMRRHLEERRSSMRNWALGTLAPLLLIGIGVLVGQAPVDFVTLSVLRLRAVTALGLPPPDLSHADLREAYLSRIDLRNVSLAGADLRGARLRGAILEGASLAGARLEEADLRGASLLGADLTGARLQDARLEATDLRQARLEHADRAGATFTGALYNHATAWGDGGPPAGALGPMGSVAGLELGDVNLERAVLVELDAAGADLAGARMTFVDLTKANLAGTNLRGADLEWSFVEEVSLVGADLRSANLSFVSLRYSNLRQADLRDANLAGADLSWAQLDGARLCGADLTLANLPQTSWDGARACARTRWPSGFAVPADVLVTEDEEPSDPILPPDSSGGDPRQSTL